MRRTAKKRRVQKRRPTKIAGPVLLTYAEAGRKLGLSVRSVRRLVAEGEMLPLQAPGTVGPRGVRVHIRDVEKLLDLAELAAQWEPR